MSCVDESVSERLARAVMVIDVVYEDVIKILEDSPSGAFGVDSMTLQSLALAVFDVRNGLRLCWDSEREKSNGMGSDESFGDSGHRNEDRGSRGGSGGDCPAGV